MGEQKAQRKRFDHLYNSLCDEKGNLLYAGRMLQHASREFGDAISLIYREQKITFSQLYQRASFFAQVLKKHGVQKGDRVVMCLENSPEFYVAYFAIWQCGAVVVPVNTFLREMELAHIVDDAKPKVIVTSTNRTQLFGDKNKTILTEQDMLAKKEQPENNEHTDLDNDEMCALLYTSGTTGVPKGVMLSSRAIVTNVIQSVAGLHLENGQKERVFGVLPLFHVFAQNTCVWAPMLTGASVIVVPKVDRRLIMHGLQHKPTFFLGVPALYGVLCLLKKAPLDSVKYFVSGGDALPDKIRAAFALLYRRKICSGYGLTETAPVISFDLDDETAPTGIVGSPLVGISCRILDDAGNELPQGEIGQLWLTGPNIMLGYYNEPTLTQEVLKDGWLNTGDLAYINRKGKIVITGRIKDLIIHKGLNIYPQEIENIILSHHNVIRVGIVGKKDPDVGEVAVAFVQLRKPERESDIENTLKKLCMRFLAPYKVPKIFICGTDELPVTATGKVDKKVLRKKV